MTFQFLDWFCRKKIIQIELLSVGDDVILKIFPLEGGGMGHGGEMGCHGPNIHSIALLFCDRTVFAQLLKMAITQLNKWIEVDGVGQHLGRGLFPVTAIA